MSEILYVRKGNTPDYTLDNPPPSPNITLYDMAEILLERTRQAFAQRGVALPARQIIYIAPIPVDCEQLAVTMSGWTPMPPLEGLTQCQSFRWCAQLDVVVSRATPAVPKGNKAPGVEQMNEAARIASEDAECLVTMVQGLGEIGPEFALEVGAPQGTYQTTVVTLQLPAYGALE